jgi:hypothetical protein
MSEIREVLEAKRRQVAPPAAGFERLAGLRESRHRNRRVGAGIAALVIAAAGIGGTMTALRGGDVAPSGPTFGGVIPQPPAFFRLERVRFPDESGLVWSLNTHRVYQEEVDHDASTLADFYKGSMPDYGWTLEHETPLQSWRRYGYPRNDLFWGSTWERDGRQARIFVHTGRGDRPTLTLSVGLVPVSFPALGSVSLDKNRISLKPSEDIPRIDREFAIQRAWIDPLWASSSRVEAVHGLLDQPGPVPDQLVWVVIYHDVCVSDIRGTRVASPPCKGTEYYAIDGQTGVSVSSSGTTG